RESSLKACFDDMHTPGVSRAGPRTPGPKKPNADHGTPRVPYAQEGGRGFPARSPLPPPRLFGYHALIRTRRHRRRFTVPIARFATEGDPNPRLGYVQGDTIHPLTE